MSPRKLNMCLPGGCKLSLGLRSLLELMKSNAAEFGLITAARARGTSILAPQGLCIHGKADETHGVKQT